MVPNANTRHFLLKAKRRDLIAAAGGIERAAAICSYSKSAVGRWNNPDSPEIMELPAIFALEEETGRHDMSEAIAAARGRAFTEAQIAPNAADNLLQRHAEMAAAAAEVMAAGAMAYSDNRLTPSEALQIDATLAKMGRLIDDYRRDLAGARANGGLSVVAGGGK